MKKIKEVKLKQDIRTPESFIPKGTIGKVTKYADYLGGELCKFTNGITDAIYQCKVRDTQDLPEWFEITYEPEFKVGDWVKVVRKVEERSNDFNNCWSDDMDKFIGKVCEVIEIDDRGIRLYSNNFKHSFKFPPKSLEPAEKPVEREKITVEIEWDKDSPTLLGDEETEETEETIRCLIEREYDLAKNLTVKKL